MRAFMALSFSGRLRRSHPTAPFRSNCRVSSCTAETLAPRWERPAGGGTVVEMVEGIDGDPAKQAIRMLADRILVQMPNAEGERKSRSGIVIPATAQVSKRLVWAEVVAVGPHVRSVEQGDQVLFSPEDRYEVEVRGDDYIILRERDVHAVAAPRIEGGTGLYL
jgi:chaperonin GroES